MRDRERPGVLEAVGKILSVETLSAERMDALLATIGRAREFWEIASQHGYFYSNMQPRAARADIPLDGDERYVSVEIGIKAIEQWVAALEAQCRKMAAEAEAETRAALETQTLELETDAARRRHAARQRRPRRRR